MGGVEPLCPAVMEDASARDRRAQTEVFTHSGDDSGWEGAVPLWCLGPRTCDLLYSMVPKSH